MIAHGGHQSASPLHAAVKDPLSSRGRPALRHRLSSQMHHSLATGKLFGFHLGAKRNGPDRMALRPEEFRGAAADESGSSRHSDVH